MGVLTNLIMVMISQHKHMSNQHVVLNAHTMLYVSYVSVELGGNREITYHVDRRG